MFSRPYSWFVVLLVVINCNLLVANMNDVSHWNSILNPLSISNGGIYILWNYRYRSCYDCSLPNCDCPSLPNCIGCTCVANTITCDGTIINLLYQKITHFPNLEGTSTTELVLNYNEIDFTNGGIPDGPLNLPSTLTHLSLAVNKIHWIPKDAFRYSHLRYLTLGDNLLEAVPFNAIRDMNELIYLGLESNKIRYISKESMSVLTGQNFTHLNLSNNFIEHIEQGAFLSLTRLTVLELHGNKLKKLYGGIFDSLPSLAYLTLYRNNIDKLDMAGLFRNLSSLEQLWLQQQTPKMTTIQYQAFQDIPALRYLSFGYNALKNFPHALLNELYLPNIHTIWCDYNSITTINEMDFDSFGLNLFNVYRHKNYDHKPFSSLGNLTILYFGNNLVRQVVSDDLQSLTSLRQLYLEYIRIENVTSNGNEPLSGPFYLPSVTKIDMANCYITHISNSSFQKLSNLQTWILANNRLEYVPFMMSDPYILPSIITLDLSNNHLTFVASHTFVNLSTLRTLNLRYNQIIAIENESFPPKITTIYLSSNLFRFLHVKPFANLTVLSYLDLYNNEITMLPLDAFNDCPKLRFLNLGYNKIGTILKAHFNETPNLQQLYIYVNEIAFIEDGTFAQLPKLVYLYASRNKLTRLPNSNDFGHVYYAIDFKSNQITHLPTNQFKDGSYTYLLLDYNRIGVIESNAFKNVMISNSLSLHANLIEEIHSFAFDNVQYSNSLTLSTCVPYLSLLSRAAFYQVSFTRLTLDSSPKPFRFSNKFYGLLPGETRLNESGTFPQSSFGYMELNSNNYMNLPNTALNGTTSYGYIMLKNNNLFGFPLWTASAKTQHAYFQNNNIDRLPPLPGIGVWKSLYDLDLSYNDLKILRDTAFTNAPNLDILTLYSNDIRKIGLKTFSKLINLRKVNIGGSSIRHLPEVRHLGQITSFDIRNHISLETINANFFILPKTSSVYISTNQLSCSCNTKNAFLSFTGNFVGSAICASPSHLKGKSMLPSDNLNSSNFYCPPKNLTMQVLVKPPQISLTWNPPIITDVNATWSFTTVCRDVLTGVLVMNATANFSYNQTFTESDGLKVYREYACSVSSAEDDKESGLSDPVYGHVEVPYVEPSGPNLLNISVDYFDFTSEHPFFTGVRYDLPESVIYNYSPFGSFLTSGELDYGSADTFKQLFHEIKNVNVFHRSSLLVPIVNVNTSRFIDKYKFFPLDSLGLQEDSDYDCDGDLHNFGFTARYRNAINYTGSEALLIGGPNDIWIFLEGHQLASLHFDRADTSIPCVSISLVKSNIKGEGIVQRQIGYMNNNSHECILNDQTTENLDIQLYLEKDRLYALEIFTTQRYPCNSSFYLEFQNTKILQAPVPAFHIDLPENVPQNFIIRDFISVDDFSIGPYQIDLTPKSIFPNAFNIYIYDSSFVSPAIPSPQGTQHQVPTANSTYLGCDFTPPALVNIPESSSLASINATQLSLRIREPLDFEMTTIYILVSVYLIDSGYSPPRHGVYTVEIKLSDVNEYCPHLTNNMFTIIPNPILQDAPLLRIISYDDDATGNTLEYIATNISIDPPVDKTKDVQREFYPAFSNLTFNVIVMDTGSPRRGSVATVTVVLSNTCVSNVVYHLLEWVVEFDDTTGDMRLRIPKYWIPDYACRESIGMDVNNAWIKDEQITASSFEEISYPGRARFNITADPIRGLTAGWIPLSSDTTPWIQVDLKEPYKVTQLVFQGQGDSSNWVTSLTFLYKLDTSATASWITYTPQGTTNPVLTANSDSETPVRVDIEPFVTAQLIRIYPKTYQGRIGFRFELIGCSVQRQNLNDMSCERCPMGFYCLGDGAKINCSTVYNDKIVQYSFGGADTCSPCPAGWHCAGGTGDRCPSGHYSECTSTSCVCKVCESGYACRGGVRVRCLSGTFSDGTEEFCQTCPVGTYQEHTAQASCNKCPIGHYSTQMKTYCRRCPPLTFSHEGADTCEACTSATDCPCMISPSPCYQGASCYNLSPTNTPKYECGACPVGMQGDGVTCSDINECTSLSFSPCWRLDRCYNTDPGYQCLDCPRGYVGTFEDALGFNKTLRVHDRESVFLPGQVVQVCHDVDECRASNVIDKWSDPWKICATEALCFNTQGNYSCGPCKPGFTGDAYRSCTFADLCYSGEHTCHSKASCRYLRPGLYKCLCLPGMAGNGRLCSPDTDLDGRPDQEVGCSEPECRKDNCPVHVNLGQEDLDQDRIGNECDSDADNDGVPNTKDNCPLKYSWIRKDSDGDGVGDSCDNCDSLANPDQADTDKDGIGDHCDTDLDGDGILNTTDNCPMVPNVDQADQDGDGVGDECDNCVKQSNANQADTNWDGYGDACVSPSVSAWTIDRDGDSIPDSLDNCAERANADQVDTDADGKGDVCDTDADNDGIENGVDNCPLVSNPGQEDATYDQVGDACSTDFDGDGVNETDDCCPDNKNRYNTSLIGYKLISVNQSNIDPYHNQLFLTEDGKEVRLRSEGMQSFILLSPEKYGPVELSATLQSTMYKDTNNYIGLVFGYQSNRRFYVVLARQYHYNYKPRVGGIKGVAIKVINNEITSGTTLDELIWFSSDTTSSSAVLWQDPDLKTWHGNSTRWTVNWDPSIGTVRVRVYSKDGIITDSGTVYSPYMINGGNIGVMALRQYQAVWSNIEAICMPRHNRAISFKSSQNAHIVLSTLHEMNLLEGFAIQLWIKPSNLTNNQGVLCAANNWFCVKLEGTSVRATVATYTVTSSITLVTDKWTQITVRYSHEEHVLQLKVIIADIPTVTRTSQIVVYIQKVWNASTTGSSVVYLGAGTNSSFNSTASQTIFTEPSEFFSGDIDEVRIFNRALPLDELSVLTFDPWMEVAKKNGLVSGHFTMNQLGPESGGDTNPERLTKLKDSSPSGNLFPINEAVFVESWLDSAKTVIQ